MAPPPPPPPPQHTHTMKCRGGGGGRRGGNCRPGLKPAPISLIFSAIFSRSADLGLYRADNRQRPEGRATSLRSARPGPLVRFSLCRAVLNSLQWRQPRRAAARCRFQGRPTITAGQPAGSLETTLTGLLEVLLAAAGADHCENSQIALPAVAEQPGRRCRQGAATLPLAPGGSPHARPCSALPSAAAAPVGFQAGRLLP